MTIYTIAITNWLQPRHLRQFSNLLFDALCCQAVRWLAPPCVAQLAPPWSRWPGSATHPRTPPAPPTQLACLGHDSLFQHNTTQLLLTFTFSAICWKQNLYFITEKLNSCPKMWWNVSFRNILLMSYLGPPLAGCPVNNHHPEWVGVGWWRGTFNYKGDLVNWRTLGSVFDKLVGASHHDNLIVALCCWFNVDDDLFRVFNEATQGKVLEQKKWCFILWYYRVS